MTSNVFDENTLAELARGRSKPRIFVKMFFDEDKTVGGAGIWDGEGIVVANGFSYFGDAKIVSVSGVCGLSKLEMAEPTLVLNAADATISAWFEGGKTWHLRRIEMFGLLFNASMRSAFATPAWRAVGLMEKATRQESEKSAPTYTIRVADIMQRSVVGTEAFFTDGSQRRRLATDSALKYMAHIGRPEDIPWGQRQSKDGNAMVHGMSINRG